MVNVTADDDNDANMVRALVGRTPIWTACNHGRDKCVRGLLTDARVDYNVSAVCLAGAQQVLFRRVLRRSAEFAERPGGEAGIVGGGYHNDAGCVCSRSVF